MLSEYKVLLLLNGMGTPILVSKFNNKGMSIHILLINNQ